QFLRGRISAGSGAVTLAELRAELEEDLAWRSDEMRHLRNQLLGSTPRDSWSISAMRALMVMQYAHLEGFTRHALSVYVKALNAEQVPCDDVQPHLMTAALLAEFEAMRKGLNAASDDIEGHLLRRAIREVEFVEKLRAVGATPLTIGERDAVS